MTRLLFFAGSTREGSFNKKLAALARHIADANGIEAVLVDLKDYPMPLYNGDLEAKEGPPERARAFKALLGEYQGVFIASPEYNSSVTPLLKNTLDWVTPGQGQGRDRARSLPDRACSPSRAPRPAITAAMRSLLHLRQILEVGIGATVIPQQIAVPRAMDAFEADGSLKDQAQQKLCTDVVEALAVAAKEVRRAMTLPRDRLIVALDVPNVEEAKALIETLGDSVGVYKIGLELLFSGGFALAQELARTGRPVFVDAKLLDIEATVERATAAIARMGVAFLTVHALDNKTLAAAVRGRGDSALKLLGVTVLTNLAPADLDRAGHRPSACRARAASGQARQGSGLRRRDRLGP